jgi:hypothetical protein
MCHWLEKRYRAENFTCRAHQNQLAKFEALDKVFRGKVVGVIYDRFTRSLDVFRRGL